MSGKSDFQLSIALDYGLCALVKRCNLGNYTELASRFAAGQIGTLSQDDSLRQMKNEGIIFAALGSRAAILGGVSPEGGYNLADYYILRIEASASVSEVQHCIGEMVDAFILRVQQSKESSQYSPAVKACAEYVETHILEKISLDAMARELGYNSYYLSSKFQKETGSTFNAFVNQRKIETAKRLIETGNMSAAAISEQLSFSSPSYFTAIFRQHTGVTPTAYFEQFHKK